MVIDFSGRPGLEFRVQFPRARVGDFDVDLIHEFFQGFVNHANVTLHVDNLSGSNSHHIAETVFKAFGRALRIAVAQPTPACRERSRRPRAASEPVFLPPASRPVYQPSLPCSRLAIIDYGIGNLYSVIKAVEHVAGPADRVRVTSNPEEIATSDKGGIPGPGCGTQDCMRALHALDLFDAVREAARQKPFLGICMGMQVLMQDSEENEGHRMPGIV